MKYMKFHKLREKLGASLTAIIFAGAVLVVLLILKPSVIGMFLKPKNLMSVVKQASVIAICAVPMTMVLITKGIDLSVGGLISLCGIVTAWCYVQGLPVAACLLAGLLCGTLMGLLDGIIIALLKPPPFVSTFVFSELALGLALIINNGRSIGPLGDDLTSFGHTNFIGIPAVIWIMLAVVAVGTVILSKLPLGSHIYALGNNELVVRQEGISVERITIFIYTFVGFCASVGGIILMAVLKTAHPSQGVPYQLDTIAACALGGVSMTGGEGKIPLAVMGAVLIYCIRNILNLLGAHPFIQNLVIGVILILVLVISIQRRERSKARVLSV